jgi:two-component system sensor histidine kinase KdpD
MTRERRDATQREVRQAVRRLHRVINNLLDMSRIESQVIHPKLDWCDIEELIQAAIDLAAEAVSENPITVEIEKTPPLVRVDQPLIEQCLCNLLLNAASNSSSGTRIIVRARLNENGLTLSVLDEGRGISEIDLPHIFETFHRGTSAMPGGTGLGLAIVDGFVRAHGGNVTATNIAPRGAEFAITIPVETLRPDAVENFA